MQYWSIPRESGETWWEKAVDASPDFRKLVVTFYFTCKRQ
jgi:hypothetical protein